MLGDKFVKASVGGVLEYELSKRLGEKGIEKHDLEENLRNRPDWSVPYRTTAERVFSVLESFLKIWVSADVNQKKELSFFFFDEHLVYEREKGYRIAQLSPVLRLFERINNPDSQDVEMAGIGHELLSGLLHAFSIR